MDNTNQTGTLHKHVLYVERRDEDGRVEYRVVTEGIPPSGYASRWYDSEEAAWQQVHIDWGPMMP